MLFPVKHVTAMKKMFVFLFLLVLAVAFFTRPDDKTCIIEGVKAVWGNATPDPAKAPALFEQFMDVNSQNVQVKDFYLVKQVRYGTPGEMKTVAYGAFKNVFPTAKPIENKNYIPPSPVSENR